MIEIKEGENIVGVYRRHKFILFLEFLPIMVASALVVASAFFLLAFLREEEGAAVLIPLILLVAVLMLHIFWVMAFVILADFYLDIWILTDRRVISIEQKGLFARRIIEFELNKVEDITVEIRGMIETFMDFGNVTLYTASENQNFVFKHIKNPNAIKDAVINEIRKLRNGRNKAVDNA